jgi:hypothetical protein
MSGGTSDDGATCYLEGTGILTLDGEVPVEALRSGDLVVVQRGPVRRTEPVVWVGRRRIDLAAHPRPARVEPVLIRAGALGENTPHRDLRVSPEHGLAVDGRLVPAGLLVNGASIVREPWWRVVTWYHVELPEHGLLLAEGAAAESYFDAGNRQAFDNGGLLAVLFPDFAPAGPEARRLYAEAACLPVVGGADDPALAAIRARLAARATDAGYGSTTDAAAPAAAPAPIWMIRPAMQARRRA